MQDELLLGKGVVKNLDRGVSIHYDCDLDELRVEYADSIVYFDDDIEAAITEFLYQMIADRPEYYNMFSRDYWRTTMVWVSMTLALVFYLAIVSWNFVTVICGVVFLGFAFTIAINFYEMDKKRKKFLDSQKSRVYVRGDARNPS